MEEQSISEFDTTIMSGITAIPWLVVLAACTKVPNEYQVQWFDEVNNAVNDFNIVEPKLKIASAQDFAALEKRSCGADCAIAYSTHSGEMQASTCEQFRALTVEGNWPQTRNDEQRLIIQQAYCQEFQVLSSAKAAQNSWLQGFQLDEKTVLSFPAQMAFYLEEGDRQIIESLKTLGEAEQKKNLRNFKAVDQRHASYETDLVERQINLLARGDFNGDNVEDVLIELNDTSGRTVWVGLYILTRLEKDGTLYLVQRVYRMGA